MINILILSAGTRDKVVQYFKEALAGKGKVIATDCSPYAPAIYEADEYVLVPRITEPGYLDKILEICREKQITGVLSLIDPELSLLADNKERFLEVGTVPIVPDAKQVDICFHKYAMYEACKALGFATGRCFLDRKEFYHAVENGELTYPVFVKPESGSASLDIHMAQDQETVEFLCGREDGLMIVVHNLGLAFMPEDLAAQALSEKRIVSIPLTEEIPNRYICLVRDPSRPLGAAARCLIDMLLADRIG